MFENRVAEKMAPVGYAPSLETGANGLPVCPECEQDAINFDGRCKNCFHNGHRENNAEGCEGAYG